MASTIDELFCDAPPDLENAIYVSYLENVFLGRDEERYRAARSSLSGRLQAALADLEDHWKKIAEWKRSPRIRSRAAKMKRKRLERNDFWLSRGR